MKQKKEKKEFLIEDDAMHNKLFLIIMPAAIAVILVTVLTLATFTIPTFAQSDGGGANQAIENAGQSANQTGKGMQQGANEAASSAGQSANQTGEAIQGNASDVGSKITEGAKDIVGSIGEKLQDLAK